MKIFKILITLITIVFLTACGGSRSVREPVMMQKEAIPFEVKPQRALIRSADISLEVEDPKVTKETIAQIVSRESGYIDNVYDRDQKQITLVVKIPANKLDTLLDEFSSLGTVLSKSVSARDITEKVTDIDAKLTNLKVLRERFRQLLGKAKNVSEVLKIEAELSRIQSTIDAIEARRKNYKRQAVLSRVHITLTQTTIYGPLGYIGKGFYWFFEKLFVIR